MCPPPIDPILPLSDAESDMFVTRTDPVQRVKRKREHEEDDDERRRQRRRAQFDTPTTAAGGPPEGSLDTRSYDDHGRPTSHDDEAPAARPHLDASA